ncbi:hypothetical protein CDD83_6412 [Cordyceps sp. RAO-2017]|nr:hypothetical protein CDD83_6412 [Cordyceps sp. RAO-2017]
MAASTFELFPRLPCELRLHVWKLAVRPPGRGLHRFSILNGDEEDEPGNASLRRLAIGDGGTRKKPRKRRHMATAPPVPETPGHHSWTHGNRSACLWDAGLWTACRESRDVMMWHFRVQHWDAERRRLLRAGGFWTPAALADEFEDVTAMAVARCRDDDDDGDQGRLHFLVQPHRDLFWLEPRDWRRSVDWSSFFLDLPFSSPLRGYGHLSHIAVEHDPSWNADLPKDLAELLQEATPRGFVARAMAECATNKLSSFIWLVDRRLSRKSPEAALAADGDEDQQDEADDDAAGGEEEAAEADEEDAEEEEEDGVAAGDADELITFYDCDRLYVETEREDLVHPRREEEYEKTALYFLHRLGVIGNGDYTLMGDEHGSGFEFQVEDYLGVLSCL